MRSLRAFVQALRDRRVLSVTMGYGVAGFGLIQAADFIFPRIQFAPYAVDWVLAGVLLAFPLVLVVAWRLGHAEAQQTVGLTLPLIGLLLVTGVSGWLGVRVIGAQESTPGANPVRSAPPLVIMMDSPHPDRVYDPETVAANGTNADVISDILLDLPIRRQRESIGPDWHRDEEILQFRPALIIVHFSGFRQTDVSGPRERLKLLISYFAESSTEFLIYSRAPGPFLRKQIDELLAPLVLEQPDLQSKVHKFSLVENGEPLWRDPMTASSLKLTVKQILDLESERS